METLKTILSILFCISLTLMFFFVLSYLMQEYRNHKPVRRHKRISKIIEHYRQQPIQRGYGSPEGYMKKVELMDMRGELNQNEYYAVPQRKISRKHRIVSGS